MIINLQGSLILFYLLMIPQWNQLFNYLTLSLYSVPIIRTPMGGSDVGSARRLLVRQAGWNVREDSPEQWDQEEVNVNRDGFLQGVTYPMLGAG